MGSRKCKNPECGARFKVPNETPSYVRWCSPDCKVEVGVYEVKKVRERAERAAKRKIREKRAEHTRAKKEFRLKDLRLRKAAAKKACHAFIRARDKGKPCISCLRPYDGKHDAGHFLESGNNPFTRYDENNIHGQCQYCNRFKGGASADYERNLRERRGGKTVDQVLALRGGVKKRTAEDYLEIKEYFKRKLKELGNS